jgi:hypothetical protein
MDMTRSRANGKKMRTAEALFHTGQRKKSVRDTHLPDWLFGYAPQMSCMSWIILTIILRHTQQHQGGKPAAISFRQFKTESGLASMSISKALAELANGGLLFRELDIPHNRTSTMRYAILAQPGSHPHETAQGLVIALLGGEYPLDPARLVPEEALRSEVASLPSLQRYSLDELQQRLRNLPPLRGPATMSWTALRERVFARDDYTCFYCGRTNFFPLHCDHVVPPARGGSARDPGNLVTACGSCNASKAALTLEEWLS